MIEAHYTTETNIYPIKNFVASPPDVVPTRVLFSDKEANKKINDINNDIYQKAQKEKKNNGFNKMLFLKIFGIIGLTVAGIACFSKLKKFFQRF